MSDAKIAEILSRTLDEKITEKMVNKERLSMNLTVGRRLKPKIIDYWARRAT